MNCYKYKIKGIIQGVGFRPFIYQLATKHALNGYVLNNTKGVELVLQGTKIEQFWQDFAKHLPPLAKIDQITKKPHKTQNYTDFQIQKSNDANQKTASIPPDFGICKECEELNDKTNRHLYQKRQNRSYQRLRRLFAYVRATNKKAIKTLRKRKNRPKKPLAIM